jgi:hypothetical protein
MNTDALNYLDGLEDSAHNGFERRFSKISTRLGLENTLIEKELRLLYMATLYATLCNIAFNGMGGCRGQIKPENESNRMNLERRFLSARDKFYGCAGWEALRASSKGEIQRIFLSVIVVDDNLSG